MSTRRRTGKAGRMLAPTIFFAAAILATAPDKAYAQRGFPGDGVKDGGAGRRERLHEHEVSDRSPGDEL